MHFQHTLVTGATAERVFALVEDPRQRRRWQAGLEETRYTSAPQGDSPVGTRFIARIREGGRVQEYAGTLTEFERPRVLAMSLGNAHLSMHLRYALEPADSNTRLHVSGALRGTTLLGRLARFAFGWLTRRILRRQLAQLKALAETGTP
ncbi:MAG: SRPBCC family protein [Candidatus Lambdaproteobacteria bacterium]|nr:SRPBCC family protein [Candidatus Lambdaproteobacteria bacterium]